MDNPKKKMIVGGVSETDNTGFEDIKDADAFIERFEMLYNVSELSDVILCVNGDRYYAHKFILTTASEVFYSMLNEKWQEAHQKEIQLIEEDACKEVFGQFLKYLYCGSIKLTIDTTLPILLLADKYSVTILQKSCVAYMQRHIVATPDTSRTLSWYLYAKITGQDDLLQECGKFILSNFSVILNASDWTSLSKNEIIEFLCSTDMIIESEYKLWLHIEQWFEASENKGELAENLKEILPLVHFSMILPKNLLQIELSPLCLDFPEIMKEKLNIAYRHHSLAVDCAEVKRMEPYRNYLEAEYKICHSFCLKDYKNVQRIDSRISVKCPVPPRFISPGHQNCEKQSIMFQVYFYPKGYFSIITLYSSYIGRRNDLTKLRLIHRLPDELPVKVHLTLVLYSVLNSVRYVSFTHNSHHLLAKENNFEDVIDNVIDLEKLTENSQYLIDGDLDGKLFIKVVDMGAHLLESK